MTKDQNSKQYDLEDRTAVFARQVRLFVKKLPMNISNAEDGKQLVRSSGSVGANYIEAKECRYWLRLLDINDGSGQEDHRKSLEKEATELMNIFGAILNKSK